MIKFLDEALFSLTWPWSLLAIMAAMAVIAVLAYKARSLNLGGAFGAFAMGTIVLWTLGFGGFLLLMLFFVSCNVVGKVSKAIRKRGQARPEIKEKKGHRRDFMQVMANGLMATIAALLWAISMKKAALIMFGAAIAEATSDTFSGEIGRLSKRGPVSILTMKPVPTGLSGGVSLLGILAAFLSSMGIALCWLLWFPGATFMEMLLVGLLGFAGAVVDSVLGAGVQAQYYDPETEELSEAEEKDGRKLELSRGIRWVDNDMVNLMSNTFSAVFALGMASILVK